MMKAGYPESDLVDMAPILQIGEMNYPAGWLFQGGRPRTKAILEVLA